MIRELEVLANTAPIGVVVLDRDENVVLWNPMAERMFGWAEKDLLGKPYPLVPEERREESLRLHQLSLEGHAMPPVEAVRRDRFGRDVHVSIACTPLPDESGNVNSVVLFLTDISARVRAEQAVRESERTYRAFFESSIAYICTHKLDGTMLSVNPAAALALGYPAEMARGRNLRDFETPEAQTNFDAYLEALRTTGHHEDESHFITAEGEERIWQYSNVVVYPEGGEPYVIGNAVDVTESKRAEERFRQFLESAPDAIIIADERGIIERVNLQAERLFGYSRQELIGKAIEMLIPQRFHDRHIEHRTGYAHNPRVRGMGIGLELYATRKDGTEFPIEISLSPIKSGKETLISTAIRDITERKRADERFRTVLEAAPDAMIIADQSGKIVMANLQAEKLFGYTRQELLGQAVEMLTPERYRHKHVAQRAEYHRTPSRRDRMGEGLDLQAVRKDGTEFPAAINLSPLQTSEGTLVLSAIRDITERKRWENALRDSEEYVRVLLENSNDSIAILEADGRLRYLSPANERIVGIPTSKRVGTSAFDNVHPDDVLNLKKFFQENVPKPGPTPIFEYRTRHADGHWVHVEAIGNNLLHNPVIHGIVVNARDITERKHAQAERERLISELQEAIGKVKTLTGLLPICASCKKIRDDRGDWNHIETYISERSEADFSHGICPECARRLYPEYYKK